MSLTYEQKHDVFARLAQQESWKTEDITDRLIALFQERQAIRAGRAVEKTDDKDSGLWSTLNETIDFPYADFPWLRDGTGADKLKLVVGYDLGVHRSMQADSMAKELADGATSAFVPWTLTTEFNGCNIGFSHRFAAELYTENDVNAGYRVRTDATNKYALLAKAQLMEQALNGACPIQPWRGGYLFHLAIKALATAPALTVAGKEHNVWHAFILETADAASLLRDAHDTFGKKLGLSATDYAVIDYGDGKILCAVEKSEYDRIQAAAAVSMRALHAIRTGLCDDWPALGRAMAAQEADLKYADPDAARGLDISDTSGVKTFSDLMRTYKRGALLQAYEAAREQATSGSPRPDAPQPPAP